MCNGVLSKDPSKQTNLFTFMVFYLNKLLKPQVKPVQERFCYQAFTDCYRDYIMPSLLKQCGRGQYSSNFFYFHLSRSAGDYESDRDIGFRQPLQPR